MNFEYVTLNQLKSFLQLEAPVEKLCADGFACRSNLESSRSNVNRLDHTNFVNYGIKGESQTQVETATSGPGNCGFSGPRE